MYSKILLHENTQIGERKSPSICLKQDGICLPVYSFQTYKMCPKIDSDQSKGWWHQNIPSLRAWELSKFNRSRRKEYSLHIPMINPQKCVQNSHKHARKYWHDYTLLLRVEGLSASTKPRFWKYSLHIPLKSNPKSTQNSPKSTTEYRHHETPFL